MEQTCLFDTLPKSRWKPEVDNGCRMWACPYFRWDAEHAVHCEGGRIAMPNRPVANAYMNAYCAGDWEKCTVAQGLTKYYEEGNL